VKIKVVVIDFETPRWARKLAAFGVSLVVVLGLATVGFATPHKWSSNDTLQADDLNGLNVVTKSGGKYSVGATAYCGTGTLTTGTISSPNGKNGYQGAKALCESSAGCGPSPSAHMCSAEELLRSAQLGLAVPTGWYSTAAWWQYYTGSYNDYASDCGGWTGKPDFGPVWQAGSSGGVGAPGVAGCTSSNPVLCCD
jgi:hypothetical protein